MEHVYNVQATWDEEASVWVATSEDVPGLVAEAETTETLIQDLLELIPQLLELNGVASSAPRPPVQLHCDRMLSFA